ncbi:MAG: hypothetical protein PHT31_04285 [Candidatus Omnitrophica bacterium]|nr:hypothetical protein [Candidatus Omnitrophota bacterium]MDD5653366.1 hypothetical protein [Candidatus Omnitrophota bacterium]
MKHKLRKFIYVFLVTLAALAFVVKFGGPQLLRLYIETGVGDCKKIPILCMVPVEHITCPVPQKEEFSEYIPHTFPKMEIFIPKGFNIVQETVKKVYYKKGLRRHSGPVIYCLYKEPDFFIGLFPQLRKIGVNDNYEFIKRVMYANVAKIQGISDAFFVIMKGIFIPDLGNQKNVKMIGFTCHNKKGFINYNLGEKENYFDCNVIGPKGDFYKVYIKDKAAALDLQNVITVIFTLEPR